MIDTSLLGETAAKCMEYLDETDGLDGGEILAVGIVVVAQDKEGGKTYTRTFCSDFVHYKQVGLFSEGLKVVNEGYSTSSENEEEEE